MKTGDRILTPDGPGVIIGVDLPDDARTKRFIIKLDTARYDFDPCYWPGELKKEAQK